MIYITGDCHGDYRRFSSEAFPEQKEMTKQDYVIVCGDFGYWTHSASQNWWFRWLSDKPFTTLFIDGNHENFDGLYKESEEMWSGGKIHKVTESIFHLMRGQIFTIDGCKIFTFGGAQSHDIDGGVLEVTDPSFNEKRKQLDLSGTSYRVNHVSWWKEELPSEKEMSEGKENLAAHENKVDYIVTHCCATSTQALFSHGTYKKDILTDYLESVRQSVTFKRWFFGHYHDNRQVNAEEIMLYEQIIRIW